MKLSRPSAVCFFSHNYAITEKNTILATCRKLEEQLEEKNKHIQQ